MKTVVTDLDGTLLNNGEVSEKTKEVLLQYQKENRLVLATGRNLNGVKHIYESLEMEKYHNGALILVNGLSFYDFNDQEYLSQTSFGMATAKKIVKLCQLLMFRVTVVTIDDRVAMTCLYDRIFYFLRYVIKHKPMIKFDKHDVCSDVQKIELGGTIFFNFFYRILVKLLKSYEVVKVNEHWIEILPKGTNKVNQLKYYIDKYQIDVDDLYVFGDGQNDMEMLKMTSHSYAPSNAMKEVKKIAKHECLSYSDDGVAKVIETIGRMM